MVKTAETYLLGNTKRGFTTANRIAIFIRSRQNIAGSSSYPSCLTASQWVTAYNTCLSGNYVFPPYGCCGNFSFMVNCTNLINNVNSCGGPNVSTLNTDCVCNLFASQNGFG